jgi:hypothetical protein
VSQGLNRERVDRLVKFIGGVENYQYGVEYAPGGKVSFWRNGKFHAETTIPEAMMVKRHGDKVVLAFGIGANANVTATVSQKR